MHRCVSTQPIVRNTNKALLVIWREGLFACREFVVSPDYLLSSRLIPPEMCKESVFELPILLQNQANPQTL